LRALNQGLNIWDAYGTIHLLEPVINFIPLFALVYGKKSG